MATPDLPVELWLEILTYLPRSALRKMIGLNRTLFELALNDLYEEVRFISDDKFMQKAFEQLTNHASIARRVRHLFIRPAFLPAVDDPQPSHARTISIFKRSKALAKITTTSSIFDFAASAVKACPYLHQVTLIVHDHAILPDFNKFLEALWAQESITKVCIDTTIAKIPALLQPLELMRNLTEFDINISVSRLPATSTERNFARKALLQAIAAFKDTLTTLTFSSLVPMDLAEVFESFPRLPHLKKFEFLLIFNVDTIPNTEGLTKFIARHSPTLETLVLRPYARQHVSIATSDDLYSIWLDHRPPQKSSRIYTLNQLTLPNLHTFDVGLQTQSSDTLAMPAISRFSPSLTTLVVSSVKLSQRQLALLLDGAVKADGSSSLEDLSFTCLTVTSAFFDVIAEKVPTLKRLAVDCGHLSLAAPWVDDPRLTGPFANFLHEIEPRRYPQWKLERLRLSHKRASCGNQHPSVFFMRQVAQCFSQPILLEATHNCDECDRDEYYLLEICSIFRNDRN